MYCDGIRYKASSALDLAAAALPHMADMLCQMAVGHESIGRLCKKCTVGVTFLDKSLTSHRLNVLGPNSKAHGTCNNYD